MPHVPVADHLAGIRGLVAFRPETGRPLYQLAEALLVGDSPLTRGERETIAAFVSRRNECRFCTESHAAAARHLLGEERGVVDAVLADPETAPVSGKMKALLRIAARVQQGGRSVADQDVAAARAEGASDRDIHDTVLIAAAFSMFNRYVDGLAALTPTDPALYAEMGRRMAEDGYAPRVDAIVAGR
ncbi:MAG TPA: peroxidase-related enzyme [Longimicrobium sp.]|nr:peroxidase-related enzyme [Longimicrobium sp.]